MIRVSASNHVCGLRASFFVLLAVLILYLGLSQIPVIHCVKRKVWCRTNAVILTWLLTYRSSHPSATLDMRIRGTRSRFHPHKQHDGLLEAWERDERDSFKAHPARCRFRANGMMGLTFKGTADLSGHKRFRPGNHKAGVTKSGSHPWMSLDNQEQLTSVISSRDMQHPRARYCTMCIDRGASTCCFDEIMLCCRQCQFEPGLIELSSSAQSCSGRGARTGSRLGRSLQLEISCFTCRAGMRIKRLASGWWFDNELQLRLLHDP